MNTLIDLAPKSVEYMIKDNIVMIDIRRAEEWEATGVIKNAHKLTFFDAYGNHDILTWMKEFEKLVTSKDQTFVLICAHANRTRVVGEFLIQQYGYKNVAHLKGGMALWLQEGREVVFD
ncbi:rhodanese-like domain-containing protein [Halarcobacter anaerophilus]|uniref:Sulfurtransferase n=1 Tax=Halarcobacter anaerophilus TaxID=877500 RepID=A0A4Q0Y0U8_9BACT|nr:rhodanese-like domain-containing protein [Halarcobacter anaerophilus]QDF30200.1 putative rhodanese-related sulfurtransferase [Halarcobacter anaerophilus]RXJ62239.1 sulfurtransferase [Halarcobacter anaerophilus]